MPTGYRIDPEVRQAFNAAAMLQGTTAEKLAQTLFLREIERMGVRLPAGPDRNGSGRRSEPTPAGR